MEKPFLQKPVIRASFVLACSAVIAVTGCRPKPEAPAANAVMPNQVGATSPAANKVNARVALGLHTTNTKLEFRPQPRQILAYQPSIWGLKIIDLKTQKGVSDFKLSHEKLMHLIVVSKDLSWFNHIHPEYKGYGNFVIQATIPRAGNYKLYADYTPVKGDQEVAQKEFNVMSNQGDLLQAGPALVADKTKNGWITKNVRAHPESEPDAPGGKSYQVALMPMPSQFKAGEAAMLHFQVRDDKGAPLADLQPYLGAMGHAVLLSQDTNIYLHTHPTDGAHSDGTGAPGEAQEHTAHQHTAPTSGGPDVMFHTVFPAPGLYKVWGQFKREDQIITAPFVVNVGAGATAKSASPAASKAAYICPMHPEVTSANAAAKCPKCGINLVKRKA